MADEVKTIKDRIAFAGRPWTKREIERQEDANRAQVKRDRARGVGANLSEAAALARFANRFAEAFKHARSA